MTKPRLSVGISILLMTLLVACSPGVSVQKIQALNRLSKIDQKQLIVESRRLLKRATEQKQYNIPKDQWPSIIADLAPVAVRNSEAGLAIILRKWISKESGFFISSEGYDIEDVRVHGSIYEEIQPSLYWYAL